MARDGGPDRRLMLVACILGSAIVFIDSTVVNVALPALQKDLHATLAGQQWVVEAYLLTLGSLVLVGGSLGDMLGRRKVFAIGVAGFGVMSLLCAVAPSIGVLVAGRALQGIAGALLVPSSLAIITASYEGEERGRAIGTWTAWTAAAIAVGPPLGGLLVDGVSWRLVFAINVPLVLITLWLIATAMPEMPGRPGHHVDYGGASLCALGLAGVVFGLIQQPISAPIVGAGLVVLAGFLAFERYGSRDPMLPLALFRSRNFAVGNLATLTIYAGLSAATFFLVIFLQQVGGFSALGAGLALVPITVISISLSRRFGGLAERIGPRPFMGFGPLVAAAGLALWLRLGSNPSYVADVLPGALLFGLGLTATVAPLTTTVLASVDERHAGVASGVNNAVARIAGLISIALVGAVITAHFTSGLNSHLHGARPPGYATIEHRPLARDARARLEPRLVAAANASDVPAFRAGLAVAAALVASGGLVSLAGIRSAKRSPISPYCDRTGAAIAATDEERDPAQLPVAAATHA
jgi:EmrB/QacA subfamily drug resistance transporter